MSKVWGIDLGGTKIEGVVLNGDANLAVLERTRIETLAAGGYEVILGQIQKLVQLISDKVGEGPAIIGIGHPGSIDPTTGLLRNSNTQCMNGRPVVSDLERILGCKVVSANDANCFALAEATMGAGVGCEVVFGVIMGTGVGGGIVVNGQVLNGLQGLGGEWGHSLIADQTDRCYCGKVGCIEMLLSGPHLEDFYRTSSGRPAKLKEIIELAKVGNDIHATATIDRLVHYFGKAISQIINILDPHKIVLGGGLSNIDLLYSRGIEEVRKYVFHDKPSIEVVKNKLGDSAGVFGAAILTRLISIVPFKSFARM